jgi:hypothetical protein
MAYALASSRLNDLVGDFHLMIAVDVVRVAWDAAAAAPAAAPAVLRRVLLRVRGARGPGEQRRPKVTSDRVKRWRQLELKCGLCVTVACVRNNVAGGGGGGSSSSSSKLPATAEKRISGIEQPKVGSNLSLGGPRG